MRSPMWTYAVAGKGKGKAALSCATLELYFANIHGFTQPPAWVPCLLFIVLNLLYYLLRLSNPMQYIVQPPTTQSEQINLVL